MLSNLKKSVGAAVFLLAVASCLFANAVPAPTLRSQEVSEIDGLPVLIKHLPDWKAHLGKIDFATKQGELQAVLGGRSILDSIDFTAGTEAVTAPYDAGKLVIVEYTSPQASLEADAKFTEIIAEDSGSTAYRRIGNYNVFVLDAPDLLAANALIDQVKYEKQVQWLGDNPFRISAERAFVLTTSDLFLSTVFVILIGMGTAIVGGLVVGYVYFQIGDKRRAKLATFSDAGGMTRLNLDGFTPDISTDKLLGE